MTPHRGVACGAAHQASLPCVAAYALPDWRRLGHVLRCSPGCNRRYGGLHAPCVPFLQGHARF